MQFIQFMKKPFLIASFFWAFIIQTAFAQCPGPNPLILNATATNAVCNGDNSGAASVLISGGAGASTAAWQNCTGGPILPGVSIIDLYAGCYAVTVTDGAGCTATASVTVSEPPAYAFTSKQDSVTCFGGLDGEATIFVTGGVGPYKYKWDNNDTTQTADNLKATFHSVTVTDAVGCQAVTLVQVLQPKALVVDSVTVKNVLCFGGNDGQATVFAKGGTAPLKYQWSAPQTTKTATGLAAGPYSVTVTDKNGCTVVGGGAVGTPTELQFQFVNVAAEKCANACDGSATIQASGGVMPYDYVWSSPNIPNGTQVSNTLCAGSYTVTVADKNGCTQTDLLQISPATPINIQLSGIDPLCAGDSNGSISSILTGGNAPYQLLWNTNAATPGLQNIPCGNYTVTVTDFTNCTQTASLSLSCPQPIVINDIQPTGVKCFGEANGQISVSAVGGTDTLLYQWNDANQQFMPVAVNLNVGNYTVTVSDINGCSTTASASVNQPTALGATTSGVNAKCFGESSGTATVAPFGGASPYSFAWNNPQTTATIINLPAGTYTPTVTDNNGCKFTAAPVTVAQPNTAVSVTASQTRVACFGESNGQATAMAIGGNGGPFTFKWSNNNLTAVADNLAPGSYIVTASDALGCSSTQTVSIAQLEKIEVNVVFSLPSCASNNDAEAAVNDVKGGAGNGIPANYSYHWSLPGAPDSIVVTGLTGGETYFLTVSDNAGCSGTFTFTVGKREPIEVQTDATNVSCFGLSDGSASVTGVLGGAQISSYRWSNNDNDPNAGNLPAGTYTVIVTDINGCTGSASVTISEPTALTAEYDIMPLRCFGDSTASIEASTSGGVPDYQYKWSTGGSGNKISGLPAGDYLLTVSDQNGCTLVDTAVVSQLNLFTVEDLVTNAKCFGAANGRVKISVTAGQAPYRYSFNGGPFEAVSTYIGLKAGAYPVVVKDANGCQVKDTAYVGEPAPLLVSIGPDTTLLLGDSLVLNTTVGAATGFVDFAWESALVEPLPCVDSTCQSIVVKPTLSNTFTVVVTDANGCQGQASIRVRVEKPRGVFVPTGFTPNGDQNNDLLVVYGKGRQIRNILVFRVYDRWGEMVHEDKNFSVNDETRGWDGFSRDKACQPGVYVWYLEVQYIDNHWENMQGHTTLIR